MSRHQKRFIFFIKPLISFSYLLIFGGPLFCQSFLPSSYQEDLNFRLDSNLFSSSNFARGPTFSAEDSRVNGVKSPFAPTFEDHEDFQAWATGHYASFYETAVQYTQLGTPEFPIYKRSIMEGSAGLPVRRNENFWLAINAQYRPSSWLNIHSSLDAGLNAEDNSDSWIRAEQLYLELQYQNVVFSVGRKALFWGQSFRDSLTISNNSTPYNMVHLTHEPVFLPWVFKYLGMAQSEIFLARLYANRHPGNDLLLAWRLGLLSFESFESHISLLYLFGGRSEGRGSRQEWLYEFLAMRGNRGPNLHDVSQLTERWFSWDGRYTWRNKLAPISLYSELHTEDGCITWNCLNRSLSYLFGVNTSLGKSAYSNRLYLEYIRTSQIYYESGNWRSSFSNLGNVTGNSLARNSQGVYFWWVKQIKTTSIRSSILFSWEERLRTPIDMDVPILNVRPDFTGSEKRYGIRPEFRYDLNEDWKLLTSAGVIRVFRKDFYAKNSWEWGSHIGVQCHAF